MKKVLSHRWLYLFIGAIVIIVVISWALRLNTERNIVRITTNAESGSVRQLVSVSGIAESLSSANLAFPIGGIVTSVPVKKGEYVSTGTVLAILDTKALYADRQEAIAGLNSAVATRDELLRGLTDTARIVIDKDLFAKRENLTSVKTTEDQKIANAYRALLSNDLTAYTDDETKEAVAPTISGTYTCGTEGLYQLELYTSNSESGFSYRLSGLETGTYSASVRQPAPLGTCGLRIIFDSTSRYNNTRWFIDIPNQKSPTFVTYKNAYSLAVAQADSTISQAEQAVLVAEAEAKNQTAEPTSEALARAEATIAQARARIERIEATIADTTLTAPFEGIITKIDILPGETVTTAPIITLLADDNFDVTARIPEIDIGKLQPEQRVEMIFDTKPSELITGAISYISPQATEIDGVAYYEATILLDETPVWMRSGLNADVEIIIDEKNNVLKLPRRFVSQSETGSFVLTEVGQTIIQKPVEIIFEGNDGYVAISGVTERDIIVAP